MDEDLRIFKTIIFHKVKITGGENEFFHESIENDLSITDLTEQEIVKWMFNDCNIRNAIIEEICSFPERDLSIKLEVKKPLLNEIDQRIIGDIDVVIIPEKNLDKTIIIEFKRIKVSTLLDKSVKVNKIHAIKKKGFSQIKKLRSFCYYKTYLGIIIEDDARNVESANTILRGSKNEKVNSIYNINSDDTLEDRAGLFFINITQPTGEGFELRYNFGITIEKEATETIQNENITERIKDLLNQ